jgi:hypothetical protein
MRDDDVADNNARHIKGCRSTQETTDCDAGDDMAGRV